MIVLIHNYKILTSELRFFPFPIILSFISLFSFLISFHVFFSIPLIVSIPLDFVTISSIHFSSIYSLFAPLSYTLPSLIVLSISLCNSQSLYLSFSLSLSPFLSLSLSLPVSPSPYILLSPKGRRGVLALSLRDCHARHPVRHEQGRLPPLPRWTGGSNR